MDTRPRKIPIRLCLIGFGAVNRLLCRIILEKASILERAGYRFQFVGVADSKGCIFNSEGVDICALLESKSSGIPVSESGGQSAAPWSTLQLVQQAEYDVLVEASPLNIKNGEPGLTFVRQALRRGKRVVLANKGPLVADFSGLQDLAAEHETALLYSATVCGGLPVVNLCLRDLRAARVKKIRGIFTSTANYVLTAMQDEGKSMEDALHDAQILRIAEADPSLDIDGWDTAAKLVILYNTLCSSADGMTKSIQSVSVAGLSTVSQEAMEICRQQGRRMRLVGTAHMQQDMSYDLRVGPEKLAEGDFLYAVDGLEMGVTIQSDLYDDLSMKIDERTPRPTAAAVLRDLIEIQQLTR